ncbi:MAG: BadF/BadG/BcrA/BcrD ATPase family protein [Isosphaeraceae bacterium]|nr:BadF/BadG/BcrA/BcrD ATPase family protein [Isosphaeraceae bacterium]
MNGPRLLGIDGGGTSTVAWLAEADGNVLGRGLAGPSNPKAIGVPAALAALEYAIDRAFHAAGESVREVDVACLGLAGFARPDDQRLLRDWAGGRPLSRRLLLVTDGDLALAAGTPEGWGVGVIAGTGSIAVGRDRDGRTARAGGWGPLIGDEGSAYAVVLAAFRRVVRRADGRDVRALEPDPLTSHLLAALGVAEIQGLIPALHAPVMDRARIAGLAPAVLAASEQDPTVVDDLLAPAGRELAQAVAAVARALGWTSGDLPLACAGGFLLAADAVRQGLLDELKRLGYVPSATAVAEPVRGAVILARHALSGG